MLKTALVCTILAISSANSTQKTNPPVIHQLVPQNLSDTVEYVLLNPTTTKHPCARKCIENSTPMTCRYDFEIEWYQSMSKACYDCPNNRTHCFLPDCIPADGQRRPVMVVNRQLPGPTIEVCLGDEVVIDVHNLLQSESTTIHWHGHHQTDSPYMDGVPYVTQCPIPPGASFRYTFHVKNAGTHFWHSHTGFQRADGAFGAFIVRLPATSNPHHALYDSDIAAHTIQILDWDAYTGLDKFTAHYHNQGNNKPPTLLVNGMGRFASRQTPIARFGVASGRKYRFRVINAGFLNCPIVVSVDNHTLTAISSDGSDFRPVAVDSIVTYAGERFDFVLEANQPQGSYWMRFAGLMDCDERFTSAFQVGILAYEGGGEEEPDGVPNYENSQRNGTQLNSLNRGTEDHSDNFISLPELSSIEEINNSTKHYILEPVPDFQYYISYDFYKRDNPHYHKFPLYGFNNVTNPQQKVLTPQLNYISYKNLPFPMLSQRHQIDEAKTCNETTVDNCDVDYCECTHIVNIALDSVVELILIDKGYAYDANHPFHLHGNSFRVVAMERMGSHVNVSEVVARDKLGLIKRNLIDAPVKDTVTVPDGGYTIVRFKASNPGYWLFHCHIEFHAEVGMALVFKVGKDEEMPPVPEGFPICGDYFPAISTRKCDLDDENAVGFGTKLIRKILPDYNCSSRASSRFNFDFMILVLVVAGAKFSV